MEMSEVNALRSLSFTLYYTHLFRGPDSSLETKTVTQL